MTPIRLMALIALGMWSLATQAIDVYPFANAEQEDLYQQLTKELRCLVCQNQNLADSDAGLATDLKDQIAEFVMAGQDGEQIKQYMIERYGDFVDYDPPLKASTMVLWFAPLLVFLLAAAVLLINIRKRPHE